MDKVCASCQKEIEKAPYIKVEKVEIDCLLYQSFTSCLCNACWDWLEQEIAWRQYRESAQEIAARLYEERRGG